MGRGGVWIQMGGGNLMGGWMLGLKGAWGRLGLDLKRGGFCVEKV